MQKIQAFLNLMTMKKEREEREGKGYVTSPFTVGVAGLALSMDSKGRIGC